MRKVILLFVLLHFTGYAQKLNQYKYAIVPEKFSFQQKPNEFDFNRLVRAAMTKYGFETYFDSDILPADLSNNNKLFVDIQETNTMIYTKLVIVLKDYRNNIIFTSEQGISKEKEYQYAYNEAFRQCAKSLALLKHQYQQADNNNALKTSEKTPSQSLENNYLNAIATKNGYDLYANSVMIYQIFKTSSSDVFIAKRISDSGIILKNLDDWTFQYYKNDELVKEKITIKF